MRLIDADRLIAECKGIIAQEWNHKAAPASWAHAYESFVDSLETAPAVYAVDTEEYNELREDFVDFVCSGIHNPAPYCKNKCEGCIDNRGWCITERCIGFNPGGERRSE